MKSLKGTLLFCLTLIVILLQFSSLFGSELINVYQKDYEIINRTVLVLTDRAYFKIDQQSDKNKFTITFNNTTQGVNLSSTLTLGSSIVSDIEITEGENEKLAVTINTVSPFRLEHIVMNEKEYKIVLDIFTSQEPQTIEEKYLYGKFFFATSNFVRASSYFKSIEQNSNYLTSLNYYLGYVYLIQKDFVKAVNYFSKVEKTEPEYSLARYELWKLGRSPFELEVITPITPETKESEVEPIVESSVEVPSNYVFKDFIKGALTSFFTVLIITLILNRHWRKREKELLDLLEKRSESDMKSVEDDTEELPLKEEPELGSVRRKNFFTNESTPPHLLITELPEDDLMIDLILALCREGWDPDEIAEEVGCTEELVEKIMMEH